MPTPIELVTSKLKGVKEVAGGWMALCPAHSDGDPSLSVAEGKDGKVLLHCHAGCEFKSVITALELEVEDLFPNGDQPPTGRIEATYDYHDADGKLTFQVVRKYPKTFLQRRPNGSGEWIWDVKGVERVVYHLPTVNAASGDGWIFVCEGEKSADALVGLGLVATCNSGGAGKWKNSHSEALRGKRVCIIPDNDAAGEDHASRVASALKGIATDVRIVHLPSVTEKSDPYDWVGAGGTKEQLLTLVEEATTVYDQPLYWDKEDGRPDTVDYIAALDSLGYAFRMNECNDQVEVNYTPISDALQAKINSQMRDLGYLNVNVMHDALVANAYDNKYHPVRDYLSELVWDGEDHIAKIPSYIEDSDGYFYQFFYRWLIGAVARAFEPLSCQNRMLILDGVQDIGKSYFVRWLASPVKHYPQLFVEGVIQPDNKDSQLRLVNSWIWEVSELGSTMRRADREALKFFLSVQQVTVRKPYGHYDLIKPALASFVGTVNNVSGFLNDPTGHRRFMTVRLTEIDWAYATDVDPEQLWAQAKHLYDSGEPWRLTEQEAECANFINAQYEMEDPLQDIILSLYDVTGDTYDFVSKMALLDTLHDFGWRLRTPRGENMALSEELKKLDVVKGRATVEGKQIRGYIGIKKSL